MINQTIITRILLTLALLATPALSQENGSAVLWDAPSMTQAVSSSWYSHHKSFVWSSFADVAAGTFDAEMSHEGYAHHRCYEGGQGLPKYATRGQLYVHNLPEQLAFIGFGLLLTESRANQWKGLKWMFPASAAYPATIHIKAGLQWYTECW